MLDPAAHISRPLVRPRRQPAQPSVSGYCPSGAVTREQMASFLTLASNYAGRPLPVTTTDPFRDDNDSDHEVDQPRRGGRSHAGLHRDDVLPASAGDARADGSLPPPVARLTPDVLTFVAPLAA